MVHSAGGKKEGEAFVARAPGRDGRHRRQPKSLFGDCATQEAFKQRRRVADAERALAVKPTKKAQEDVRIGSNLVERAVGRLDELRKPASTSGLGRIYPGSYCPVVVMEEGRHVVRPMRYRCRLPGWNEVMERKYPGTYNARRDNLEKSWGKVFGITHGVVLATSFYEHVDRDGSDTIFEFKPADGSDMIAACIWTRTVDRDGEVLYSFAAVTDDPPAEISEAGHDRCIIPIKRENLDAWLTPNGDHAAMYAILDDRERPFSERPSRTGPAIRIAAQTVPISCAASMLMSRFTPSGRPSSSLPSMKVFAFALNCAR